MIKWFPVLGIWGCLAVAGIVLLVWDSVVLALMFALLSLFIVTITPPVLGVISRTPGKLDPRVIKRYRKENPGTTIGEAMDELTYRG
ncbi:hypothetical protein [Corynebacterium sp. A21]|uniref:hypothetical protein n=1 Tax=Corynebacterium sp. A21 TaxID=3457318 RepID=UPI003FD19E99